MIREFISTYIRLFFCIFGYRLLKYKRRKKCIKKREREKKHRQRNNEEKGKKEERRKERKRIRSSDRWFQTLYRIWIV